MTKRGKCPSLITGNHGKPVFKICGRKTTCKRCKNEILKGERCVDIPKPGSFGGRRVCCNCLQEMICKSRQDLDKLERELG